MVAFPGGLVSAEIDDRRGRTAGIEIIIRPRTSSADIDNRRGGLAACDRRCAVAGHRPIENRRLIHNGGLINDWRLIDHRCLANHR